MNLEYNFKKVAVIWLWVDQNIDVFKYDSDYLIISIIDNKIQKNVDLKKSKNVDFMSFRNGWMNH